MNIEFDPAKADSNQKKHGILFTDAATVLDDPLSVTIEETYTDEERFVNIGMDVYGRVLTHPVIHIAKSCYYSWGSGGDYLPRWGPGAKPLVGSGAKPRKNKPLALEPPTCCYCVVF